MSNARRRPPFRTQSLGSILLRMLQSMLTPGSPRALTGADDPASGSSPRIAESTAVAIALATLALAALASILTLGRIVASDAPPPAPTPPPAVAAQTGGGALPVAAPPLALIAPVGVPVRPLRTYGLDAAGAARLLQPQEAVRGRDGLIYVADTGNRRIAVLDAAGRLVRTIAATPSGPLQAPSSLTLAPSGHLLVLDSELGRVIAYDIGARGHDAAVAASDPSVRLVHARGIGVDAMGRVAVADPATNAIVILGSDLAQLSEQSHIGAGGAPLFDQPSAVAFGPHGSLYLVDSQNNTVKQFSAGWSLLRSWPLVTSDTLHSPRLLPLRGGGLLVSDPQDGKLLLYRQGTAQPRAFAVTLPQGVPCGPLGLARAGDGVLVTCNLAGRAVGLAVPGA